MIHLFHLVIIIVVTLGGLAISFVAKLPLAVGFAAGLITLIVTCLKQGIAFRQLLISMRKGIVFTREVVWILLLVGLLIPAWTASGIIPYLIDTSLQLLNPAYLVTGCFIAAGAISMVLGTATGTLSFVGIPFMGAASLMGVPLPLVAGALISGAIIGDRTSPFSGAHQLAASSTGVASRELGRSLLPTTIAGTLICFAVYLFMDIWGSWAIDPAGMDGQTDTAAFSTFFTYHPILWLSPLLLIGTILFRVKTKYGFLLAIVSSLLVGTMLQGVELMDWVSFLWQGYIAADLPTLHTKGIADMLGLIILIALAGAFNGILEEHHLIEPYIDKLWGQTTTLLSGTLRTASFGLALALISCTQTLPIMMTGRSMLPVWQMKYKPSHLARVVSDTSLLFAVMIPWNMLAILCATILGVSVQAYLPYAVFLWIVPLLTFILSGLFDLQAKKRSAVSRQ